MDKQQAFSILVDATGQLSANREVHAKIQEALQVIQKAIGEKPVEGEVVKEG
jgi:hypothetical protein